MSKLNGWMRLWIIISVLITIPVALFSSAMWPIETSIKHSAKFYARLPQESKNQLLINRDVTVTFNDNNSHIYKNVPDDITPDAVEARANLDFPSRKVVSIDGGRKKGAGVLIKGNQHLLYFKTGTAEDKIIKIKHEYEYIIFKELKLQRIKFCFAVIGTWLGIVSLIYLLGSSFHWVYRGFVHNNTH